MAVADLGSEEFRNALAEGGHDIRIVQRLLGRGDVTTTMIYVHVPNRAPAGVRSPDEGHGSGP